MKSRTYRLDDETIELLKQLSEVEDVPQAEIVRKAIVRYSSNTAQDNTREEVVELLKDEVSHLRAALHEAQAVQAIQAQAQTKALESAAMKARPWWKFWGR